MRSLPVGHQVVVDGIGLEYHDLALGEQLGEDVTRSERCDVARSEHECDTGVRRRRRYASAWVDRTSCSLTPGSIQTSPVTPA